MANIQKYQSISLDKINEDDAKVSQLSGNVYMQLEVGQNVIRAIPPPPGKNTPYRITAMHYIDAIPGTERRLIFACPRVELKQPCAACAKYDELRASPNPNDRDRARQLEARLQVYMNVVDRKCPDVVKVMRFGPAIYKALQAILRNPRLGGDFTNPYANGFDLVIQRDGSGPQDTRYTITADRNSSALADNDEQIDWYVENQHNLDRQVNPIVPEELIAFWQQANFISTPIARQSLNYPQRPALPEPPARPAMASPKVGGDVLRQAAKVAPPPPPAKNAVDAEYEDDFPIDFGKPLTK